MMSTRQFPGRVGVPRAGFGVPPKRTSRGEIKIGLSSLARASLQGIESSQRRDAFAGARDAHPTRALLLALAWLLAVFSQSHATEPDTFSPVVSYQYQDSLDSTATTITSRVVSYQYYDWPGDENLTFQNSPSVSYFFDGPPQITMQPLARVVQVGQSANFNVIVNGSAPLTYQWRLNGVNIANTNSASIQITNAQLVNAGAYSVVVRNQFGSINSADSNLKVYLAPIGPVPQIPNTLSSNEGLPANQTTPPTKPTPANLHVFNSSGTLDPRLMTIVMTHGWNSNSGDWPTEMGNLLKQKYDQNVNIVAWDWEGDAKLNTLDPSQSAARTVAQGVALANTLMDTLGAGYVHPIHFLGHSLGTLVNCKAADYLHGDFRPKGDPRSASMVYSPNRTHMTLFDEAEVVTGTQGIHLLLDIYLGLIDKTQARDGAENLSSLLANHGWSKVIPDRSAWVDSYISEVGLPHPSATNVLLWRRIAVPGINDIIGSGIGLHGYSYMWYKDTIATPQPTPLGNAGEVMGFYYSFERSTLGFAPYRNTYYQQNLDPFANPLAVTKVAEGTVAGLSTSAVLYPTAKVLQGLSAAATAAVAVVSATVNQTVKFAGNVAVEVGSWFSRPAGTPVYPDTAGSTPAYFTSSSSPDAAPPQATYDYQFTIQKGDSVMGQKQTLLRTLAVSNSSPNTVFVIIPVHVPKGATSLSFEYQINNSGLEDFMTMGIGDANKYSMEAKFLIDGEWNGTPVIQVSDYADRDVNLTFALNGVVAPPSGTLEIRAIQFYIPPKPQLELGVTAATATASWPISAIDWTLETTTDLTQPNWQPVEGAPDDTDYFHTVTFDLGYARKAFFRLRK